MTEEVLEPEAKMMETVGKSLHKIAIDEPSSQREDKEPSSANETDGADQPLKTTLVDRLYNAPFGTPRALDAIVGRSKDAFKYRRTVKVFLS